MIDAFRGLNDSLTLLAFRVKNAKKLPKIVGTIMVSVIMLCIYAMTYTNKFVLQVYSTPTADTPAADSINQLKNYIGIYLRFYKSGEIDTLVTLAVVFFLGSIFLVPLSGYTIHGVVSNSELTILKNGDYYRIGDSVVFQFISSFTFIQLTGLTFASQLFSINTHHPGLVTIFVWACWISLALFTSLVTWVSEYISLRYKRRVGYAVLGIIASIIILILAVDPKHGTTLFGASHVIFEFLNQIGDNPAGAFLPGMIGAVLVSLLLFAALSYVAKATLVIPDNRIVNKPVRGRNPIRSFIVAGKVNFTKLTLTLLFRYTSVVRPVVTSALFSLLVMLVLGGGSAVSTTLVVLPLATGVSFGANMFGLYGNANNWLLSLPEWRNRTVAVFASTVAITVGSSYIFIYGIAYAAHRITTPQLLAAIPAMLCLIMATTVTSVLLSLRNPLPFSAKTRENVISSPMVLMGYVAIFIPINTIFGNIPYNLAGNPLAAIIFTAITLAIGFLLLGIAHYRWTRYEKGAQRVLNKTVNAG